MTSDSAPTNATVGLARRLGILQQLWQTEGPRPTPEGDHLVDAIADLVAAVGAEPGRAWLLVVALTAAMPEQPLVHSVRRNLSRQGIDRTVLWLLSTVTPLAIERGSARAGLRILTEHPVLDVSALFESDGAPGDRRLMAAVVSGWCATRDLDCVRWTSRGGALRALAHDERAWMLDPTVKLPARVGVGRASLRRTTQIVVPWGVPVLVTGAPSDTRSDRLAALAELTPSTVRLVGRDCAPISSAETVTHAESADFCHYLELVKQAEVVVCASVSAAAEFGGFAGALGAQGLTGPRVVVCPLPTRLPEPQQGLGLEPQPAPASTPASAATRPLVACVDHPALRVNRTALLAAAELLWREGLDFEVRLLVSGWAEAKTSHDLTRELQRLARPIVVELDASDSRVAETLARARCLVHPTLHEGYGLPVIEALATGVPVITSDFGSVREIAEGRGALLVDPTDVDDLAGALRSLLTDGDLHTALASRAGSGAARSIAAYADELWEGLLT